MQDRKALILKLRAQKLSYEQIGEILEISKQRVHQIFKTYNTSSDIPKTIHKCVVCGNEEFLECHHKDFDSYNHKSSNLEWRCVKHHKLIHKGRKCEERMFSAPDGYVTIKQASALCGVDENTIIKWLRENILQKYRTNKGFCILKTDLPSYLRQRKA